MIHTIRTTEREVDTAFSLFSSLFGRFTGASKTLILLFPNGFNLTNGSSRFILNDLRLSLTKLNQRHGFDTIMWVTCIGADADTYAATAGPLLAAYHPHIPDDFLHGLQLKDEVCKLFGIESIKKS